MNKTKYISLLLSLVTGITLFFSCKKTIDKPTISTISGTVTIAQLRAMYNGQNIKFTNDVSLYATVTMSDNYKTVYLRDNTGTIGFKQLSPRGIYQGDELRINLNKTWLDLSSSAGSIQIDSMDVGTNVVKLSYGNNPAPVVTTIYQLMNSISNVTYSYTVNTFTFTTTIQKSIYDGQLVQLNDVQFLVANAGDTGKLFLPPNSGTYVSNTLTDCGALNTIVVSTYSNTPEFMQQKVPGKSGSLIAIAAFYGGTLQLTLRSAHEVNLTQPRCGADTLTQNFVNFGLGANFSNTVPGWYNINQVGFKQWTGQTASNLNFPETTSFGSGSPRNVMWLISPAIQSSPTKNLTFRSATKYWNNYQVSVLISKDFIGLEGAGAGSGSGTGTNLNTTSVPSSNPATWVDITSQFPAFANGGSGTYIFSNASAAPVQLSPYLPPNYTGTFHIAFRYSGNNSDSTSTYAINNVIIKN